MNMSLINACPIHFPWPSTVQYHSFHIHIENILLIPQLPNLPFHLLHISHFSHHHNLHQVSQHNVNHLQSVYILLSLYLDDTQLAILSYPFLTFILHKCIRSYEIIMHIMDHMMEDTVFNRQSFPIFEMHSCPVIPLLNVCFLVIM